MQPYCVIVEDLDAIEPYSGFDGVYNNNSNNCKTESQMNNFSSSVLNHLDAPYLSISPMMALSDGFETKSDEDESIDLSLGDNFQFRYRHHSVTQFAAVEPEIHESLSADQCNTFDQIRSNWTDLENVPDFLKYDLLLTSKSGCCADPTLAELNAKSIFDDLTGSDCLPLSEECSQFKFPTVPTSPQDSQDALILPTSGANTLQSIQIDQTHFPPNLELVKTEIADSSPRRSTLQDLLLQNNSVINRCPSPLPPVKAEVQMASPASSVPNYVNALAELDTACVKHRPRTSTISSTSSVCGSLPGTSLDSSQRFENEYRSDGGTVKQDSDSNDECSESDGDDSNPDSNTDDERFCGMTRRRTKSLPTEGTKCKRRNKRGRYFWQYNLQAKGPKGNRLPLAAEFTNPHKLEQVTDPVFSPRCIIKGIKHTGKARKGDGNDLTPNPEKLHQIGQSLRNLNQIINDLTPVNELPVNVRPKSRKEKNKLASRVCRLKKKAQHEANKLKLYGLQHEHGHLMHILKELKKQVRAEGSKNKEQLLHRCCNMENQLLRAKVAGRTVEFVNDILDKVASGVPAGGLEDL